MIQVMLQVVIILEEIQTQMMQIPFLYIPLQWSPKHHLEIERYLRSRIGIYGEVIEARIIHDRETGRSRDFGFVSFTSNEEATDAITGMDGKDLHGRLFHVNYAIEKTGGFHSGGGGYSQNDRY